MLGGREIKEIRLLIDFDNIRNQMKLQAGEKLDFSIFLGRDNSPCLAFTAGGDDDWRILELFGKAAGDEPIKE